MPRATLDAVASIGAAAWCFNLRLRYTCTLHGLYRRRELARSRLIIVTRMIRKSLSQIRLLASLSVENYLEYIALNDCQYVCGIRLSKKWNAKLSKISTWRENKEKRKNRLHRKTPFFKFFDNFLTAVRNNDTRILFIYKSMTLRCDRSELWGMRSLEIYSTPTMYLFIFSFCVEAIGFKSQYLYDKYFHVYVYENWIIRTRAQWIGIYQFVRWLSSSII